MATLNPDPGLVSVLNELYAPEPVVQAVSDNRRSVRIMGGSYAVGSARIFIPCPLVFGYGSGSSFSLLPEASAFAGTVTLGTCDTIQAGGDYGVYLGDNGTIRVVSWTDAGPSLSGVTYRCLGGFSALCGDVGALEMRPSSVFPGQSHPLSGFLAGDVVPKSVWAFNFRPSCKVPTGMAYISETDSWMDIYLNGDYVWDNTGKVLTPPRSAYNLAPMANRSWTQVSTALAQIGKRLPSSDEFYFAALGSNCGTVVDAEGGVNAPRSDTAGKRMVSSAGCESMCGQLYQWLSDIRSNSESSGSTLAFDGWRESGGSYLHNPNSFGAMPAAAGVLIAGGSRSVDSSYPQAVGPLRRQSVADADAILRTGYPQVSARGCCGTYRG